MRTKMPSFHIQHNTTPEVLRLILAHCSERRTGIGELAERLSLSFKTVQRNILPFIRQLGLLDDSSSNTLAFSTLGAKMYSLGRHSPSLFAEAMHQLLYTLYVFDSSKRFSWAYARIVDALWTNGECVMDGEMKAYLVGMVAESATQEFCLPAREISFSTDSVRGVLHWLRAMEPALITREGKKETFRRRYYCDPIVFLWAVDFLYRANNHHYGIRMFLLPERIEQLCKLCVLDPTGLDNVLMMAKRISDYERKGIFDYGTEGGFGRWILLMHPCPVPSLPSDIGER